MFKLHIIQARFGDCFLLEYGNQNPEFILIDGGPNKNYDESLQPALLELIKADRMLEALIVSHVDNDHIMGVLDLLTEIKYQHDTGKKPFVAINELWFNSFSETLGANDLEKRIHAVNAVAGANGMQMQQMSMAVNGIKGGNQITSIARFLDIPINPGTEKGFYLAGEKLQTFKKLNLEITVIGPTMDNLKNLQDEWEEWIKKNEQKIATGRYTKDFAKMSDRSIPNLSSIVLLIKSSDRSLLLTGDCRGDHLLQGLIETGLSVTGSFHVDIFKIPHHGSKRNSSKEFFEQVTADTYIISADGTYDNPDEETLQWIVDTAKAAGRKIKMIVTNTTASTEALLKNYNPEEWGYEIQFIKEGEYYLTV